MDTVFSIVTGDVYTLETDAAGTPYDFDISIDIF